jgi:hypothetical protein
MTAPRHRQPVDRRHRQTVDRRHRQPVDPRRLLLLGTTAVALVALGVGTAGIAQATWTAPAQTVGAHASTGSVAVTIAGVEDLATTYSSAALSHGATVRIVNSGTVPADIRLALTASVGATLSTAQRVDVWQPTATNPCSGSPSSTARSSSGSTIPDVTASLAAGASTTSCVRTSVTQGQRFDLSGGSTTLDAVVTARQGSWSGTAHARATQAVAATVTPGMPTKTSETDSTIALTWSAPADTSGIASYVVSRNGVPIATLPASTRSFTDTGLQVSTYYAYDVRAVPTGPAGHSSPASTSIQHATGWFTSSGRYALRNPATGTCVTAGGTSSGSPITTASCTTSAAQTWQFSVDGDWLRVSSPSASQLYWDAPSDRSAVLRTVNDISAQKWAVEAVGAGSGLFRFRNKNNLCLTTSPSASPSGTTAMTVADCDSSAPQLFTMRGTS